MQYNDHTETAAPEACPYAVLGLGQRASLAEIKKAYKSLVLQWHPDKNREYPDLAAERFRAVSEAYAVLSDTDRRRDYDNHGHTAPEENAIPAAFHNARDLFREVFGGVGGLFGGGGYDHHPGGHHSHSHSHSTSSFGGFFGGCEGDGQHGPAPVGTPMDTHAWSAPVSRSNSNSIDHGAGADPFAPGGLFGGESHPHHNPFAQNQALNGGQNQAQNQVNGMTGGGANCAFGDAGDDLMQRYHSNSSSSTTLTSRMGSILTTSTTTIANGVKTTHTTLQRPGEALREKTETFCLQSGRVTSLRINGEPQPTQGAFLPM